MDITKIKDILDSFDKERAIMIDGPWGIGKTYQVAKYIDNYKGKDKKFIYISLYGKKSIDEIHTQLYHKIHPTFNIIKNAFTVLTPAMEIIPSYGNILEKIACNSIDAGSKHKDNDNKIRSKKQITVVFDDFERMSSEINPNDILGYFNQLFLSNIKIIVICNSKEIVKKEEFNDIQEKIFDYIYRFESTDFNIANDFFGEHPIDENIFSLFENNLRNAHKSASFFENVLREIKKLDKLNYEKIDEKTLMWYCSLVVSVSNNKNENIKIDKDKNPFERKTARRIFTDQNIIEKTIIMYKKDCEKKYPYRLKPTFGYDNPPFSFIVALSYYYFYFDFLYVNTFLLKEDNNILKQKNIFYYSDEGKRKYIKDVIDAIKDGKGVISEMEVDILENIYKYKLFFPMDYDEDKFVSSIVKRMDDNMYSYICARKYYNQDREFLELVKNKYYHSKLESSVSDLTAMIKEKNKTQLIKYIKNLDNENKFVNTGVLEKSIANIFLKNYFWIPDLDKEIESNDWELVMTIVDLLTKNGYKDSIIKLFKKQENEENSESKKERIGSILNYIDAEN